MQIVNNDVSNALKNRLLTMTSLTLFISNLSSVGIDSTDVLVANLKPF